MQFVMGIDHMFVVYLAGALIVLVVALALIFVQLRHQINESKRLSVKLDKMVNQVLAVGEDSDYNVRTRTFR